MKKERDLAEKWTTSMDKDLYPSSIDGKEAGIIVDNNPDLNQASCSKSTSGKRILV